ncbi:MAG TPA: alkaline phosphatase family protein [Vicinamibacterales bacterium]|nr:alkaline phosphatase family protein [Vicinamibacterales bacterium]
MRTSSPQPPDPIPLAVGWGVLWSVALGLWIVAPVAVETHHIRPEGLVQWSLVIAGLGAAFAVIGAVLGYIGGFVVVLAERMTIGRFYSRPWAYGLLMPFVLSIGYVAQAVLIHWTSFRTLRGLSVYPSQVLGIAAACAAAAIAATIAYRFIVRSRARPPASVLAWCAAAAAIVAATSLAAQTTRLPEVPELGGLERTRTPAGETPLLFIGLDGATWRVLEPAIASGAAPTLRRLVESGMHGTVEALWPPHWSGAAWAAIVTGLPREVTGVYEDLAAEAPGLPIFQVPIQSTPILNPFYTVRAAYRAGGIIRYTPPPRPLLRGIPVWQLLHRAGVDTAVVRWRFTFPPEGQAGIVVSDFVGNDQWEEMGVRRPDGRTAVAPAELADRLLAPFETDGPSDPALFSRLLPGPRPAKPADALGDPIVELELASDIDDRTFEAAESILRMKPRLGFAAVYIGGLDSVEHAFWQYRFPEDYANPPAQADIERLGPVLDRYVQYFDARLARLLALYEREPNVVIVSDHGQGASTTSSKWRGWHTKEGIFIAAGPSVPHRAGRIDVSYYDVLPTLVALKGFSTPEALPGRSVVSVEGVHPASRLDWTGATDRGDPRLPMEQSRH